MDRILNYLYFVKIKPGLLLGEKSLERLRFSMGGYAIGIYECEGEMHSEFQREFQKFIEEQYNNNIRTERHWSYFILQHSKDDKEAFDNFYMLLDEFLERVGKPQFSSDMAKTHYIFPSKTHQS